MSALFKKVLLVQKTTNYEKLTTKATNISKYVVNNMLNEWYAWYDNE